MIALHLFLAASLLAPSGLQGQDPEPRIGSADLIATPSDCVSSLEDQSSPGNCIPASTQPTLGMLYPLSSQFFVDPFGWVGIGTTTPTERLHVSNGSVRADAFLMAGYGNPILPTIRFGDGTEDTGLSSPGIDTIAFLTAGAECARFDAAGRLGIGTSLPAFRLDVLENGLSQAVGIAGTVTAASGSDNVGVQGRNRRTAPPTFVDPYTGAGVEGLHDGYGSGVRGCSVSGTGVTGLGGNDGVSGITSNSSAYGVSGSNYASSGFGSGVRGYVSSPSGYGVYSSGDLGASGAKFFVQPHPLDPTREIRFVSLEGNESGTYFRGSTRLVNGVATIDVPEEFRLVSEPGSLTVQVTPLGDARVWVEEKTLERIEVRGRPDVAFDYFVNGVRRGFAGIPLVRENSAFVPTTRGEPYGTQYPDEFRRILVENGTLNRDFTPNEETALRLGWELHDAAPLEPLGSRRPEPERIDPQAGGRRP